MKKIVFAFVLVILIQSVDSHAWDTTAAKYYPLSVGNVYVFNKYDLWFSCNTHEILATYYVHISNTTLKPNGKTYYQFSGWWNLVGFGSPSWTYQRIDSNSMNVYAYDSVNNSEFLHDSLSGTVNTNFDCERLNFIQPHGWYERIDQMTIFNSVRNRRQFQCSGPIIAGTYYYLVEGIGFTGFSICELGSGEEYKLKGCVLDGIVYGDTALTSIHQNENLIPDKFSLSQNFPNPFNPVTDIPYSLSEDRFVTLKVYDVSGNEIATLVNEKQTSGTYSYQFSTVNYQLASGIYFYKLEAGDFSETKRMILLK
ncbi:MAG: T9SS type A sorting domain-containing protein [Ignavibacteria bacterium]|nr:T9SS type A sorting domain-containing protein [Ignavibacteria bacterium]